MIIHLFIGEWWSIRCSVFTIHVLTFKLNSCVISINILIYGMPTNRSVSCWCCYLLIVSVLKLIRFYHVMIHWIQCRNANGPNKSLFALLIYGFRFRLVIMIYNLHKLKDNRYNKKIVLVFTLWLRHLPFTGVVQLICQPLTTAKRTPSRVQPKKRQVSSFSWPIASKTAQDAGAAVWICASRENVRWVQVITILFGTKFVILILKIKLKTSAKVFEIKLNALNYVHSMQAKWPCDKFPALMARHCARHARALFGAAGWSLASRVYSVRATRHRKMLWK